MVGYGDMRCLRFFNRVPKSRGAHRTGAPCDPTCWVNYRGIISRGSRESALNASRRMSFVPASEPLEFNRSLLPATLDFPRMARCLLVIFLGARPGKLYLSLPRFLFLVSPASSVIRVYQRTDKRATSAARSFVQIQILRATVARLFCFRSWLRWRSNARLIERSNCSCLFGRRRRFALRPMPNSSCRKSDICVEGNKVRGFYL